MNVRFREEQLKRPSIGNEKNTGKICKAEMCSLKDVVSELRARTHTHTQRLTMHMLTLVYEISHTINASAESMLTANKYGSLSIFFFFFFF